MKIAVEGLACLGSFGAGVADLLSGLTPPQEASQPPPPAPRAEVATLGDFVPPRALRQTDHFTRMALLGAFLALQDAEVPPGAPGTGIILASGYGPASPTFQFLDSIVAHGELMASPLSFSHSVHNIPAGVLALTMGISGPCATFCQHESSVASALMTAASWLEEKRVQRVLFGAVDECTSLLINLSLRVAEARAARGRTGMRRALPLAEGAAFFCLSAEGERARRGTILEAGMHWEERRDDWQHKACRNYAAKADTVFISGALPQKELPANVRFAAGNYGNIPIAQAFDLILALQNSVPGRENMCLGFSPQGLVSHIRVERPQAL